MASFEGGSRGRDGGDPLASRIAIKFLLGNGITGSLIGTKGSAVKCLIDMSGAKVYVSNGDAHFPGSADRVILVSGSLSQITVVQSLIWHLIANQVRSSEMGERSETWDPYSALDECNEGIHDEVIVTCKLSIPQAAAGMILGRNGSSIRSITEESGARISMASKDDGMVMLTHERVLTITGPKINCVKCTSLVVAKLAEDTAISQYAYRGTSYAGTPTGLSSPSTLSSPSYGGSSMNHNGHNSRDSNSRSNVSPYGRGLSPHGYDGNDDNNYRGGNRNDNALPPPRRNASGSSPLYPHQPSMSPSSYSLNNSPMYLGTGQNGSGNSISNGFDGGGVGSGSPMPLIDALTTISLAVPEALVGNILGRNGNAVREISSLSGAKVLVSPRGEYIEGTTNRLVTIQGSPECAQTAHHFIVQRLQQGALLNSSSGPERSRGGTNGGGGPHGGHRGVGKERGLGVDAGSSIDRSRQYNQGGGRGRSGNDDDRHRHRDATLRGGGNRGSRGGSGSRGHVDQHDHHNGRGDGEPGKMHDNDNDEGEEEEEEQGEEEDQEEGEGDVYDDDEDEEGADDDGDDGGAASTFPAAVLVNDIAAGDNSNATDRGEPNGNGDHDHDNDSVDDDGEDHDGPDHDNNEGAVESR